MLIIQCVLWKSKPGPGLTAIKNGLWTPPQHGELFGKVALACGAITLLTALGHVMRTLECVERRGGDLAGHGERVFGVCRIHLHARAKSDQSFARCQKTPLVRQPAVLTEGLRSV